MDSIERLRAEDPTVIGSYRLKGRLEQDANSVTFLAQSAGGRDVMVVLLNDEAPDIDMATALNHGMFGRHPYIVREYVGPPLPARKMKQSRDWGTPVTMALVAVLFLLSALVIGYLWYYNIRYQPAEGQVTG